ncbi:MAG: bacterioferritin [Acidimicrobiia bacterium]|jgi:bacterioferritin
MPQGRPEIIELLNDVLTAELTAINQYFGHYRILGNWGFERLAERAREESIDEMKHADEVIDRILYLEGHPNLQRLGPVRLGEDPVETLRLDLDLEHEAVERLNRGIALAVELGDNGTRELLADILTDEEEHVDWLETQLDLVERLGANAYLAQQLHDDGDGD